VRAPLIVAGLIGIVAGLYSGVHLLIPLILTGLIWWATRRLLPGHPADFVAAAAAQAGHLLWITIGLVVIGALTVDLLDIAILLGGAIWLLTRPGLAAVVVLTIYQVLGLLINLIAFLHFPIGDNLHKALLIHMIWRGLALVFMWRGQSKARRHSEVPEETA